MKHYIIKTNPTNKNNVDCYEVINGNAEYMKRVNSFEIANMIKDSGLGKIKFEDKRTYKSNKNELD
jgi:predicted HNH restriction endonuclease